MATAITIDRQRAITGCLLGGALGDALGLPYEGLSPRRARLLLGDPDRHRLVSGRGMFSDDTDHACLTAEALLSNLDDVSGFRVELARKLRWWFAALPAGVGMATARACVRLWLGISPEQSGVWSAGNGPAMRAAILGVTLADIDQLRAFVTASSRLTHRDPRAIAAALAVACAARYAARSQSPNGKDYLEDLKELLDGEAVELVELLHLAAKSAAEGKTPLEFAATIGLRQGVSGFSMHSIPVAIQAWLRFAGDYRTAVRETILCGGDTDTNAFLVGSLVGAHLGTAGIPREWREGVLDWPRTVSSMERLAAALSQAVETGEMEAPRRSIPGATIIRNVVFLGIVLAHGFRRLAPPY